MSTSKESLASTGSQLYQHVLRRRYTNPALLKQALDELCGQEEYTLMELRGRWILKLPKQLTEAELEGLEVKAFHHYGI
ncbi:uncharacterized protein E0L32_004040 [Thyridium curvatum]|uniref:Uncharacterized protein n=1 Tax=Thyridium curvatum TaxID=1093900 RepID=A0A507BHC0_9PEZI|nr:uncharacterized protein E0L32_004040 [Thyridium curvatum]TPX16391.1 hypothetical protein E0L32_004040 [Thyridium curvatum]